MNLHLPKIVFGSSALGNLYEVVPDSTKREIVRNWLKHEPHPVIDSAGKYGAGLALENIGRFLGELGVEPGDVRISNKLGWKRVPLTTCEPTFEQGVWFGLEHDAAQWISYEGILECYHQGNELLGDYKAKLLSVHDPDEYLAAAADSDERRQHYDDILGAYKALHELKQQGEADSVGIGSKDWTVIKRLFDDGIRFDWIMLANSFTIYRHPNEILDFMSKLNSANTCIINSAVFNAGFLVGGAYFDYQIVTPQSHPQLYRWRETFHNICASHGILPAHACCQFGLSHPAIKALALNTGNPEHVARNVSMVQTPLPGDFWRSLKAQEILPPDYPYLGT